MLAVADSGADGSELLKLQTTYVKCYMAFFSPPLLQEARLRAEEYITYPVQHWRELFVNVGGEMDELLFIVTPLFCVCLALVGVIY